MQSRRRGAVEKYFFPLRFSGKATYVRTSFLFFLLCQGCVRSALAYFTAREKTIDTPQVFFSEARKVMMPIFDARKKVPEGHPRLNNSVLKKGRKAPLLMAEK